MQGSANSIFQMRCFGSFSDKRLMSCLKSCGYLEVRLVWHSGLLDTKPCSLHYTMLNLFDLIWKYDFYWIYIFPPWTWGFFSFMLLSGPQLSSLMMSENLTDSKFISTLEAMNKFMNHTSNVKSHCVFILKCIGLIKLITVCQIKTIYWISTMCQRYSTHFTEMDIKPSSG